MNDKKLTFSLSIGFANAHQKETFTFHHLGIEEDDYDNEDELNDILEEEWRNWSAEYIDGGWDLE